MANEELREENYNKALLAAIELFSEFGVEHTDMTQIAKKAGVSRRSVFRYFGTKDDLVLETIQWGREKFSEAITKLVNSTEYQNKNGCEQMMMLYRTILQIAIDYCLYYVNCSLIEAYAVQHSDKPFMRQYECGCQEVVCAATSAKEKGLLDGSINPVYKDDGYFYVHCMDFRGFFYRMAIYECSEKHASGLTSYEVMEHYMTTMENAVAAK